MTNFQKIIVEIAKLENIKVSFLSKNWIIGLKKGGITKYIAGYKFGLNDHALGSVLDDKYALYDCLLEKGLPIIKYHILYGENNKNEYALGCNSYNDALKLFKQYNQNIVLKPNNGTCGVEVYHIEDKDELKVIYEKMLSHNFSISVCPFYQIETEYRTIILNGNVELLYGKIRPIVVGDGKSTIKELLINFNFQYFKDYNLDNKDIVLAKDEVYEYDWKFNLSRGSKMFSDIPQEQYDYVASLALKTAALMGLNFGSVDIIKTKDNKFYIMEINSGVMMDNFIKQDPNGYQIAKNIYHKAIISMFGGN